MNDTPSKDDPVGEAGTPVRPKRRSRGARPSTGRITLGDVARLAGVSSMTVSRVINRPETVSEDIRRIVEQAIESSGYVPNLLAGGLASSRTRLVAAIVPTVAHVLFSASVQYLTDRLAEEGYQVLLGLSGYPEGRREEELVKAILARVPEALYLTGTNHSPATRQRLRAAGIPIVETWDLSRPPIDMAVGFSHEAVGERVAAYFHARGHHRATAISAGDERAMLRCSRFEATARSLGIDVRKPVITPSPSTLQMGRQGLAELVESDFRSGAIFTSSDSLAHGVVLEAQSRGIAVPEEIAVIGFGDLDYAANTSPPLSSVSVDRFAVGRLAAEAILTRLAGGEPESAVIDVGFEIVERGTT